MSAKTARDGGVAAERSPPVEKRQAKRTDSAKASFIEVSSRESDGRLVDGRLGPAGAEGGERAVARRERLDIGHVMRRRADDRDEAERAAARSIQDDRRGHQR